MVKACFTLVPVHQVSTLWLRPCSQVTYLNISFTSFVLQAPIVTSLSLFSKLQLLHPHTYSSPCLTVVVLFPYQESCTVTNNFVVTLAKRREHYTFVVYTFPNTQLQLYHLSFIL